MLEPSETDVVPVNQPVLGEVVGLAKLLLRLATAVLTKVAISGEEAIIPAAPSVVEALIGELVMIWTEVSAVEEDSEEEEAEQTLANLVDLEEAKMKVDQTEVTAVQGVLDEETR